MTTIYELDGKAARAPWVQNGAGEIEAQVDPDNSSTYYAPVCQLDEDWAAEMVAAHGAMICHCRNNFMEALDTLKEQLELGAFAGDRLPIKLWREHRIRLVAAIKKLEEVPV